MAHNYSDDAQVTSLTASFDSDTNSTMTVAATTGFPSTTPYYLAINRGAATQEIVSVTSVAGLTLTVTHISGSTATQASGSPVEHVAPAVHFDTVEDHLDATAAHGATGALVGTTNTQTLTNKTISGASNTLSAIPQSAVTNLATDLTGLRVKSYEAAASGALTMTTTATDIPGATVTITTTVTNTVALVIGTYDVSSSGTSDTFVGSLIVDGSAQSGNAISTQANRATVTQAWAVTLASTGSHTLKLQASKAGAANTVSTQAAHTKIVVTAAGI